jgi:hypothetical protein
MNWGYKIMTVYIVFVAGIAVMVYKSSSQKIDLVTTDYYAKELKYQDRINAIKRTETLSAKVAYEVKDNTVIITLPSEFGMKEVNGNALLYYPADNGKDIKKDFTTNNRIVIIPIPANAKGSYQLQLNWIAEESDYYFEENIFL